MDCKDEAGTHPFDTTRDGLRHASDCLGSEEGFFDPLSVLEIQGAFGCLADEVEC